jgi:ankyrin repeat protein
MIVRRIRSSVAKHILDLRKVAVVMRSSLLPLWFGLLGLCRVHCDPLTLEQLKAIVQAGDVTTITNWLLEQYASLNNTYEDLAPEDRDAVVKLQAQTVFLYAVQSGETEVVKAMIDTGVDPNDVLTPGGESALYIATIANDQLMQETLKNGGADPLYGLRENDTALAHMLWLSFAHHDNRFPNLCFANGLDPNHAFAGLQDDSLLDMSIKNSNLEAFKYMISMNADISIVRWSNNYKTTLALAIQNHGENSDYVDILRRLGAFEKKYTTAIPDKAISVTDRLRIRDSPNQAGKILGYLNKDDPVRIVEVTALSYIIDGIDSPWICIVAGKTEGWVFGGYLSASQH